MKRVLTAFLTVFCVAAIVFAIKTAADAGLMKKYPDAEKLTDSEEALRPGYSQLSDKEKAVYTALYRGISRYEDVIGLPYEISGNSYSKIYCLLEKQEGRFFYIDSTYYTAKKVREAKIIYREQPEETAKKNALLEEAISNALQGVTLAAGEYEAVLRIHDYLVRNCMYSLEGNGFSSTAYGCLVEKKANCEGYAKAFGVLMSRIGVECVLVTGVTDKGENHAWNQVKLDGEWYNVDVTWDDTDIAGDMRRVYLLCDDDMFGKTHMPDGETLKAYACTSDENNYYNKSGLFADSEETAAEILRRELEVGNRQIDMRFANEQLYNTFKRRYIDNQEIFDVITETIWGYSWTVTVSVQENLSECCLTIYLT